MNHLNEYAASIGVTVTYTDLAHLARYGDYNHERREIRIQNGLLPRKARHVLAHELGHATYGDEPTMFSSLNAKLEARADEWAARFLISPDAYADAEERACGHIPTMAQELYVVERTVLAFQRTLHRIGNTIYVKPRMGVGQWEERIVVA